MSNNIKILIVEDEQMLAEILSDTLSDRNFDVHLAYDGVQALESVKRESFDVIVSDIMMPNLDGFSAVKEIKRTQPDLPFIMLSALGEEYDKIHGFDLGVDD